MLACQTLSPKARLSSTFAWTWVRPRYASKAKLSRTELGDRAIEPLYPTFFTAKGIMEVLSEPLYSELTGALQQAIDEKKTRSPIERALMQADVWAAYDIIYEINSAQPL